MSERRPFEEVLATDGWWPLDEYVPSRDYVYVKGFGFDMWHPRAGIARRGRHRLSFWWNPAGETLRIDVKEWKPIPDGGVSPHARWLAFRGDPNEGKFVRPPEPVYEPGDTSVRLTPTARSMLEAMQNGAILHERAWRWTEWHIGAPRFSSVRIGKRDINALRKVAFIQRDGVLPPGRLPRWFEFDWSITDAGMAWLAANAKPAASAAQSQETTT
jgi:hypothetical protein